MNDLKQQEVLGRNNTLISFDWSTFLSLIVLIYLISFRSASIFDWLATASASRFCMVGTTSKCGIFLQSD
jgi:hypothetical protein